MVTGPFRVVEYPEGVPKNAPPLLFSVPPLTVTPYRPTVAPEPLAVMFPPALLMVVLARYRVPLLVASIRPALFTTPYSRVRLPIRGEPVELALMVPPT